ncbi:hypothetical protein PAPYR_8422 [Paratrimastix pyriformis]|uniref:Uncharacterized protein n=1 Tax=Paratrimastix pyriformis TaxID=342808 RepID=A0ABQ8UD59_9EUKA|nr:hypothetical protein PAPYR_8422 [Paratrimastix pyriformis]
MDEDGAEMSAQPRSIIIEKHGLEAASLLGLLTRHGARLRVFSAADLQTLSEDWPQLVRALSGLPRLTRLTLNTSQAHFPLSLPCPHLQMLSLFGFPGDAKVVLTCPPLRSHTGRRDQLEYESSGEHRYPEQS